jgi:hypothetical protein
LDAVELDVRNAPLLKPRVVFSAYVLAAWLSKTAKARSLVLGGGVK